MYLAGLASRLSVALLSDCLWKMRTLRLSPRWAEIRPHYSVSCPVSNVLQSLPSATAKSMIAISECFCCYFA